MTTFADAAGVELISVPVEVDEAGRACPKCSRRMRAYTREANDKQPFRCPDCRLVVTITDPEPAKSKFDSRPHCVRCRRFMWRQLQSHGYRFRCPVCEASCYEAESGRAPSLPFTFNSADVSGDNPCCLKCRGRMRSDAHRWRCNRCKLKVQKSIIGAVITAGVIQRGRKPVRLQLPGQPKKKACPLCLRPMNRAGFRRNGRQNFTCRGCPFSFRKLRDGETLYAFARSRIPPHLPDEVRVEAAQALAVDLLQKKVAVTKLKPSVIRRYVRAAYGYNDAKRFTPLDSLTRGGSPLGAMLEG